MSFNYKEWGVITPEKPKAASELEELYNEKNYPEGYEPPEWVTKDEAQYMIDAAITKHNRNAGIISMWVGFFVLGLFSEGLLRLVGAIPPLLPWLKITL